MKHLIVAGLALLFVGCDGSNTASEAKSEIIIHDTVIIKVPPKDTTTSDTGKIDSSRIVPVLPRFRSVGDSSVVGSWLQYKYSVSAGSNIPNKMWVIQADGKFIKNSFTPCPGETDINSTCGRYEFGTVNFDKSTSRYSKIIDSTAKKDTKGGELITITRGQITASSLYRHVTVSWRKNGGLLLDSVGTDTAIYTYWSINN